MAILAANISGDVHRASNWASVVSVLPMRWRCICRQINPNVMATAKNCAMAQNHCESLPTKLRRISVAMLLVDVTVLWWWRYTCLLAEGWGGLSVLIEIVAVNVLHVVRVGF